MPRPSMAEARNPLSALGVTIVVTTAITFFAGLILILIPMYVIPVIELRVFELRVFILGFIAFGAGIVAGRSSLIGLIGFTGGFLGGFVAAVLLQLFLWPTGWELILSLALGAIAGGGSLITAKLGFRGLETILGSMRPTRRCPRCNSHVGLNARKCWSCRAILPPT